MLGAPWLLVQDFFGHECRHQTDRIGSLQRVRPLKTVIPQSEVKPTNKRIYVNTSHNNDDTVVGCMFNES